MSAFGSASTSNRSRFLSLRASRLKKAIVRKASRLTSTLGKSESLPKKEQPLMPVTA